MTEVELEMILFGASHPFSHDFGRKLVDRLACEAHELKNLRPRDCVTNEVHFYGECAEVEVVRAVL